MTRYAVGDLQGCLAPLEALLQQVDFNPPQDQLWLVGDLVNRGPDSLATLRFLYNIKDALRITLGNHDLHCLALARGAVKRGRHPSLEALLNAPDCETLMEWLRQQPLVYRDPSRDYIMSHAGIPPIWSSKKALALSSEVSELLRSDQIDSFLTAMYGNEPACWNDTLSGLDRARCITNYLTRMRLCQQDGNLELDYSGALEKAPAPYKAWFHWPPNKKRKETVLFGHWAALQGDTGHDRIIGLDTGCVWGNCMSLLNLDSGHMLKHSC